MEIGKTNKLKQEIEEYLTKDYCCEFKKECKDGTRVRCSKYEAKLYLILRFAEPREKQIAELSKHILEIQKDKGELVDKCRELEQQIEKMKCCENCAWWYKLPNGQRDCAETCENLDNWSFRKP